MMEGGQGLNKAVCVLGGGGGGDMKISCPEPLELMIEMEQGVLCGWGGGGGGIWRPILNPLMM